MMSFFIVVDFAHEMNFFCICVPVFGEFDPINVAGHRSDPQKEIPCLTTSVRRNVTSISNHWSVSRWVRDKI